MSKRVNEDGFRVFYEEPGGHPRVIESSLAFKGPHVWIANGSGMIEVSLAEAAKIRAALDDFIAEANAGTLTEKP